MYPSQFPSRRSRAISQSLNALGRQNIKRLLNCWITLIKMNRHYYTFQLLYNDPKIILILPILTPCCLLCAHVFLPSPLYNSTQTSFHLSPLQQNAPTHSSRPTSSHPTRVHGQLRIPPWVWDGSNRWTNRELRWVCGAGPIHIGPHIKELSRVGPQNYWDMLWPASVSHNPQAKQDGPRAY